jgi:hypothetical protein
MPIHAENAGFSFFGSANISGSRKDCQYFTKRFRSGDFSRFLAARVKSLLRLHDLLIVMLSRCADGSSLLTVSKRK